MSVVHAPASSSIVLVFLKDICGAHTCARARTRLYALFHQACVVFFDEVDAIGGARFDDGAGGDNEVQRTMLEIVNQLDGFDARGNVKVRGGLQADRRSLARLDAHDNVKVAPFP